MGSSAVQRHLGTNAHGADHKTNLINNRVRKNSPGIVFK